MNDHLIYFHMCELCFQLKDGSKLNLNDLKKHAESGGNVLEKIHDSKMKVVWPHEKPPPTGEVRAKLIHQRMHKQHEQRIREATINPKQGLATISNGFILLITFPAIAYALYIILRWLGVSVDTSKIISLCMAMVFLLAEIGLVIIQQWKADRAKEYMVKRFNTPVPHINKVHKEKGN